MPAGGAGADPAVSHGRDRGGRRPVLLPVVAGVVGPLFDEPDAFRPRRAGGAPARAGGAEHLHRRQFLEVRRLARPDLLAASGTSRAGRFSRKALRGGVPARIRRDLPHGVRRFRLLPVPHRGVLAQAASTRRRSISASPSKCRNRSPARFSRRTRATARRRARRTKRSWTRTCCSEMFLRPLLPYRDKTALLIFEFGAFGQRSFARCRRISGPAGPVPGGAAAGIPLRGGDPQSRSSWSRTTSRACAAHRVAHVYNAWSKMPELRHQIAIPDFGDGRFPGLPRAAAPRARVRGRGGDVRAVHGGAGPESRRRAIRCGC